jgi:hypothetical protein
MSHLTNNIHQVRGEKKLGEQDTVHWVQLQRRIIWNQPSQSGSTRPQHNAKAQILTHSLSLEGKKQIWQHPNTADCPYPSTGKKQTPKNPKSQTFPFANKGSAERLNPRANLGHQGDVPKKKSHLWYGNTEPELTSQRRKEKDSAGGSMHGRGIHRRKAKG